MNSHGVGVIFAVVEVIVAGDVAQNFSVSSIEPHITEAAERILHMQLAPPRTCSLQTEALFLQSSTLIRNPASCPVHSSPGTLLWAALSGNSSDPPPACLQELELIQMLVEEDQGHLFAAWPPYGKTLICAHQQTVVP